jgi:hypothetical protein
MDKFYQWLKDNNYGFFCKTDSKIYLYFKSINMQTIETIDLMLIGYKIKYIKETGKRLKWQVSFIDLMNNNYLNDIIKEINNEI